MTRLLVCLILLLARCSPAYADSINVAFSPSGGATEAVVGVIDQAGHTVHLAGYGFTSRPIAAALIRAYQRGVDVDVVLDKSNATARYTEAREIAGTGIPVRIDYRYAIMHDKYIVVDGVTVETGSFNFTSAAERSNAENVLVLHEMPDVAARYEDNFIGLWNESVPYAK